VVVAVEAEDDEAADETLPDAADARFLVVTGMMV
jgi:hypothetical protein